MKISTQNQHQQAINRVVNYINSHLDKELSVSALADLSHISIFHFHRIFSSVIGESIGAYITRLRLETAAQMLSHSDTSITDIAEACGYRSLHALSKAFKKQMGTTPSSYRSNPQEFSRLHTPIPFQMMHLSPSIESVDTQDMAYVRIVGKYGEKHFLPTDGAHSVSLCIATTCSRQLPDGWVSALTAHILHTPRDVVFMPVPPCLRALNRKVLSEITPFRPDDLLFRDNK